jgi:hypothetical protein
MKPERIDFVCYRARRRLAATSCAIEARSRSTSGPVGRGLSWSHSASAGTNTRPRMRCRHMIRQAIKSFIASPPWQAAFLSANGDPHRGIVASPLCSALPYAETHTMCVRTQSRWRRTPDCCKRPFARNRPAVASGGGCGVRVEVERLESRSSRRSQVGGDR